MREREKRQRDRERGREREEGGSREEGEGKKKEEVEVKEEREGDRDREKPYRTCHNRGYESKKGTKTTSTMKFPKPPAMCCFPSLSKSATGRMLTSKAMGPALLSLSLDIS